MSFKFLLSRIVKGTTTMDLRADAETRKVRCEKYARKHKTCGKKAVFAAVEKTCPGSMPGMAR